MFRNIYSIHHIGYYCKKHKIPIVPQILAIVKRILFPACDIPFTAQIGGGARFPHRAIGVVIHEHAVIGANVKIETNVTIGGARGKGVPIIGDNCLIGTGASIIGGVVIGDDVIIGAGAVVVNNVPDGSIVVGVPAKVIKSVPDEWLGIPKT